MKRGNLIVLLFAVSMAFGQGIGGHVALRRYGGGRPGFWVDSVNGSDTNNGRAPGTPYQTLGKLLTNSILPRSTVYLVAGSTFREEFSVPSNYLTIKKTGSGANPVIDGSDAVSAGAWSKTGGRTSVYQATLTHSATAATVSSCFNRVWEDTTRMVQVATVALCDSTANSYNVSSETAASFTLYVHASDGSNPGSSGKSYSFTQRGYGIGAQNKTYTTVSNIDTRRALNGNGSLEVGQYSTVTGGIHSDGGKHNILAGDGSVLTGITATDRYYPALNDALVVFYEATGTNAGASCVSCIVQSTVLDTNSYGIYSHTTSGNFGTLTLNGVTATNLGRGLTFDSGYGVVASITNFTCTSCTVGVRSTTETFTLTTATIRGGTSYAVNFEGNTTTNTVNGLFTDRNIFGSSVKSGNFYTITNSVFDTTAVVIPIQLNANSGTNTTSVSYCTFQTDVGAGGGQFIQIGSSSGTTTLTSDHNAFRGANGASRFSKDNVTYSLAQWQALPQDANSTRGIAIYVDNTITDTNVGSATPDFWTYNAATFATTGGQSPVYKTVADINIGVVNWGDTLYFRKGQTWSETLSCTSAGGAGAVITYDSFGSGAFPIITGATSNGRAYTAMQNLQFNGLQTMNSNHQTYKNLLLTAGVTIAASSGSQVLAYSAVTGAALTVNSGAGVIVQNVSVRDLGMTINETSTITNSISWGTSADITINTGKTVTGTYNIFGDSAKSGAGTYSDGGSTSHWSWDPLYTGATDLHLQAGSPAINFGTALGLTTDLEGYAISGNPDAGAYEFH
jgi:hypothetical protein